MCLVNVKLVSSSGERGESAFRRGLSKGDCVLGEKEGEEDD